MAKQAESFAKQAADRVREAVEAAEGEAREIVARAEREAERIRGAAEAEARQRLEQAQEAVERLARQADEVRSALSSEVPGPEVDPTPATVPEPEPAREPEPTPPATPEPEPPSEPEPQPVEVPEPSPPQPGSSGGDGPSTEQLIEELKGGGPSPAAGNSQPDEQGARLVAMKMALEGKPREEVERHLAESHAIADPAPLLDEVYSRVGK